MIINNLPEEIIRLKDQQIKLKKDIAKYKKAVEKDLLAEEDKDKLLNNFNFRLKQNQWILKKITSDIEKRYKCGK